MPIGPKSRYRFNTIPTQISIIIFVSGDRLVCKLYKKDKEVRIAETILKKQTKVGGISLPELKMYKCGFRNQDGMAWQRRQYLGQGNRIKNQVTDPRKYTQLSRKDGKAIQWGC